MDVVEPEVALRYGLEQVQDVVNVNFLARFLLLFWAREFDFSKLLDGKALLDIASCLPVLGIPARIFGGAAAQSSVNLVQLARFFRLLKKSLPSAREVSGDEEPTGELQTVILFLALGGTIAVSATLLYLYEGWGHQVEDRRTFEDALLYMVTVFAGRDTPFNAATAGGKQVTVAATLLSVLFVPFLISESFVVFGGMKKMSAVDMQGASSPGNGLPMVSPQADFLADALRRLDWLEACGRLSSVEAKELRKRCLLEDRPLQLVELRYGRPCKVDLDDGSWEIYTLRLRELLSDPDLGRGVLEGEAERSRAN